MKKVGMILLCGLLLVGFTGCNKATSKAIISTMITKEANPYFHKNEELLDKVNALGKEVDAYMSTDDTSKALSLNFGYDSQTETIASLYVNSTSLSGVSYSDFIENPIIQKVDKELIPGLIDFIKEVEQEDKDLSCKTKIIDNHVMTMYPFHLYEEDLDTGYEGSALQISFNPVVLDDPLFKQWPLL